MTRKKRYTSEEKTMILREYLENNVPISELAEKYGVHPNAIYKWKKQMFESTPENLASSKKKQDKKFNDILKRNAELEELLSKREAVIAELVEENISLKKKENGDSLKKYGLSRK